MEPVEILGFAAGAVVTLSLVPQVWRIYQLKSAREISLAFTIAYVVGIGGWFAYGLITGRPSLILWNGVSVLLALAMLIGKLRYRAKG